MVEYCSLVKKILVSLILLMKRLEVLIELKMAKQKCDGKTYLSDSQFKEKRLSVVHLFSLSVPELVSLIDIRDFQTYIVI